MPLDDCVSRNCSIFDFSWCADGPQGEKTTLGSLEANPLPPKLKQCHSHSYTVEKCVVGEATVDLSSAGPARECPGLTRNCRDRSPSGRLVVDLRLKTGIL